MFKIYSTKLYSKFTESIFYHLSQSRILAVYSETLLMGLQCPFIAPWWNRIKGRAVQLWLMSSLQYPRALPFYLFALQSTLSLDCQPDVPHISLPICIKRKMSAQDYVFFNLHLIKSSSNDSPKNTWHHFLISHSKSMSAQQEISSYVCITNVAGHSIIDSHFITSS